MVIYAVIENDLKFQVNINKGTMILKCLKGRLQSSWFTAVMVKFSELSVMQKSELRVQKGKHSL